MINDDRIFEIEILAHREYFFYDGVHLFVRGYGYKKDKDNIYRIKNIEFEPVDADRLLDVDWIFAKIQNETAQALMDSLWECGIRPTQGKGSAGQLDAVKYHLDDMRRLVFRGEK